MRLIDADALLKKWQDVLDEKADEKGTVAYITFELFIERLKEEPTIDAVPVVLCKDCKYYYCMECKKPENAATYWDKEGYDTKCYIDVELDHFCSYGERKTDGEDSKVL